MKKIIVSAVLLTVGYTANAQIKSNQPIKDDITGSNAFLDGSTGFSIKSNDNKIGKGLVFPDTDLTTFEFDTSLADGQTFPTWFNGMVVYNIGTGQTGANANKQGIQVDVTPGFYYFSNPNGGDSNSVATGKWVRIGGDATNTGLWQKQPNGDILLVDTPIKNNVIYKPNGGYTNTLKGVENRINSYWDKNTRTVMSVNFIADNYENEGAFYNIKAFGDQLPNQTADAPYGAKYLNNSSLLLDNNENSNIEGFVASASSIKTQSNSTKNYRSLYANSNYSMHFGTGKANMMIGSVAASQLFPDASATRMVGSYNEVLNRSKNRTEVMEGTFSYVVAENEGFVQDMFGSRDVLAIKKESTGTINWLEGHRTTLNIEQGYTGTINNYTGVRVFSPNIATGVTGSIKNMYGLYVSDINKGTDRNFSIYTEVGQVRLGDLKGTGDRIVLADQNGVLKTGNASSFSSRWTEDTGNNAIKLAVTSTGATRTTAPVSITDEGMVRATSFQGVNGATIFPDYVFQKYYTGISNIKSDYNFKSLSQVEDFVKANGHLPGYKSAETIKAQGYVDLMETQLTNVEKIEELYLHSIEQDKVNKQQAEALKAKDVEIADLKQRLERLEKLIQ